MRGGLPPCAVSIYTQDRSLHKAYKSLRGPEVERWIGLEDFIDPAVQNDWSLLPFMALADGAHASVEEFSYFTLRYTGTGSQAPTSLFGISCSRQLDAKELLNRPADVTRSAVQKAVVVISANPQYFGQLREKLSIVTRAWFAQKDFTDVTILEDFRDSLAKSVQEVADERDQYLGLSLRECLHEFKWQTLVLFKCLLLQKKMLFFGAHCERLCMMQFALISLIPGLLRQLQDCADPSFSSNEEKAKPSTGVKTSDRPSLLAYMGLPLQIFGKGSLFGPYTPLQLLDVLADQDTKSYVVGSTNSLLLGQKEKYSDVLINLDENTVTINNPSLRSALNLTVPDRRWIDAITQAVNDTWDPSDPGRPNNMGYLGSEDFIRLQFEEYLLALLSAVKYRRFVQWHREDPKGILTDIDADPAADFSADWVEAWLLTSNYRTWMRVTDSHLFDIVEPTHPATGGLTIDDIQRRLASQVADLHLDERYAATRETLSKNFALGQERVSTAINSIWADVEARRRRQLERSAESRDQSPSAAAAARWKAPDMSQARATAQAAGKSAGAYFSSWGAWAAEKRKTGWKAPPTSANSNAADAKTEPVETNKGG